MDDRQSAMAPGRAEVIQRFKQSGGKIAAVFPIHYPRALLRAHGLLPVEVWGPPGTEPSKGDAHLQAYTCSIVRCGLSFLLSGGLSEAELLLVPHACDSLQGLGSVLRDFVVPGAEGPARKPVLNVYPPRGEGRSAVSFLAEELRQLDTQLTGLVGGGVDDDVLQRAIDREERADSLLAELCRARRRLPLGSLAFYRLARSREYLPAEDFIELARSALDAADQQPQVARAGAPAGGRGPGVLLSGLVPEPMEVFEVIDQAGAEVVADDLACCGRRLYAATSATEDPFVRMARGLLSAAPDSTRGSDVAQRAEHLVALADAAGASAVIFYLIKFCEPEQFYLPLVRRALEGAGLRSVAVEVDLAEPLPDQIVTRIEALLETLR